jgi:dolichol-phosphate mannosyltransferase
MAPRLALIVPTYCEKENLAEVVRRVREALAGWGGEWEILFVDDDSPDGTLEELRRLQAGEPRVRFLRRIGRRGLSSACLEGMASTGAEILGVMDADLQHDEKILPEMLARLEEDPAVDLVVGTRYAGQGGVGDWSRERTLLSQWGTKLEKLLLRTSVSDPLSGFFLVRSSVFEAAVRRTSGKGFKILLDLMMSSPRALRVAEVPYTFRPRLHGESKLDILVGLEYLLLLLEKLCGRLLPVRFLLYVMVGCTGLLLHLVVLWLLNVQAGWEFRSAQWAGTLLAMLSNFVINNFVTFRGQRLRGAVLLPGLALYVGICALGALANVEVASYLFDQGVPWWLAGTVGAGMGAVWNYAVSTQVVWTWFQMGNQKGSRLPKTP